jgi:hypothetical protein
MSDSKDLKKEIADVVRSALKNNDWDVQEVDYRTILIKVPSVAGPTYFQLQVKEMY